MRYSDYHLHSEFSFDSDEKIENICEKAVNEDIEEIVLTDHLEVQDPQSYPDFVKRRREIERCREMYQDKVIIKSGVEIGQPHYDISTVNKIIKSNDFDFILASLHIVKGYGSHSKIIFTEDNVTDYIECYLAELFQIASDADYDVLAHVTLPFKYIPEELKQIAVLKNFEEQYRKIFRTVADRKKGIEINASGMRTLLNQTMPSAEVLNWYEDEGGEIVTIGSDGHSVRNAFLCLDDSFELLSQTKAKKLAHYTRRILSFKEL